MQTQFETEIDGVQVTTSLFDYDEAAEISAELMQKALPIIDFIRSGDIANMELEDVAKMPVFTQLTRDMNPVEWASLLKRLLTCTSVVCTIDGKKQRVDLSSKDGRNKALQGRVKLSFMIAFYVIRVNFQDFFSAQE